MCVCVCVGGGGGGGGGHVHLKGDNWWFFLATLNSKENYFILIGPLHWVQPLVVICIIT